MAKVKTYVEFNYPGSFFSESSSTAVKSRDITKLKSPDGAFSFRFYDVVTESSVVDGKKVAMQSQAINKSNLFYIGGRLLTVEDVERTVPDSCILVSNMKCNGWKHVIQCRTGNFQPFEKTDTIIDPTTKEMRIVKRGGDK